MATQNSPEPTKEPTKIIDLNDDCLGKIFERLDLRGLVNVAIANEFLRPVARIEYKRRFGGKSIEIFANNYRHNHFEETLNFVAIYGLKKSLEYLRCLGPSIGVLMIWYMDLTWAQYEYIHQYINEYCAGSLASISFLNKPDSPIERFEKPFVNVRSIFVCDGSLGNQFTLFPKWFPNVVNLRLENVLMSNARIDIPFDHLQHLNINVNNDEYHSTGFGFTETEAAHLLQLCPQLDSLRIGELGPEPLTMMKLLDLIKDKPLITKLAAWHKYSKFPYPWEVDRLMYARHNLNELDLESYIFDEDTAIALIQQLGALKKFRFRIYDPYHYNPYVQSEYNRIVARLNSRWKSSSVPTDLNQYFQIVSLESND